MRGKATSWLPCTCEWPRAETLKKTDPRSKRLINRLCQTMCFFEKSCWNEHCFVFCPIKTFRFQPSSHVEFDTERPCYWENLSVECWSYQKTTTPLEQRKSKPDYTKHHLFRSETKCGRVKNKRIHIEWVGKGICFLLHRYFVTGILSKDIWYFRFSVICSLPRFIRGYN